MKKNYIEPKLMVINIETQGVIATSTMQVNSSDTDGIIDNNEVLSRKSFSIWDDDDEEEEEE